MVEPAVVNSGPRWLPGLQLLLTNKTVVANFCFRFVYAIVVTGDGASTHINFLAQFGITHIAEMINLTVTNNGFFGLDKAFHLGVAAQFGAWPYSGKRSQCGAITNTGFFNHRISFYFNAIADAALIIWQLWPMLTRANFNITLKQAVDINSVVGAGFQCRAGQNVWSSRLVPETISASANFNWGRSSAASCAVVDPFNLAYRAGLYALML